MRPSSEFTLQVIVLSVLALVVVVMMTSCADPQRFRQGRDWCAEVDRLEKC